MLRNSRPIPLQKDRHRSFSDMTNETSRHQSRPVGSSTFSCSVGGLSVAIRVHPAVLVCDLATGKRRVCSRASACWIRHAPPPNRFAGGEPDLPLPNSLALQGREAEERNCFDLLFRFIALHGISTEYEP
jgi:hypothetical protein